MKELQGTIGGRPRAVDDLMVLQAELTTAVGATLQTLGPCVMQGCQVSGPATGATITAGIVLLDGQLLRFAGASGVLLPAQFQAGAVVESDPRVYQTAGTKFCMREVPAVVVVANSTYTGGEFLPVDTYGALTYWHRTQTKTRTPGEVQWLASFTAANYDTTGLGKPGTEAWGWQLLVGAAGRFPVVLDPANPDYAVPGLTGGSDKVTLNVQQLPAHSHGSEFRITDSRTGDTSPFTSGWTSTPNANGKNITTTNTGGGQPFDNRPPFYTLGARQWVGY